jgi:hypothetical protein
MSVQELEAKLAKTEDLEGRWFKTAVLDAEHASARAIAQCKQQVQHIEEDY